MPFETPEVPRHRPQKTSERRIETAPINVPTRREAEEEEKRRKEDPNWWREQT
jgi:hypothetical protein